MGLQRGWLWIGHLVPSCLIRITVLLCRILAQPVTQNCSSGTVAGTEIFWSSELQSGNVGRKQINNSCADVPSQDLVWELLWLVLKCVMGDSCPLVVRGGTSLWVPASAGSIPCSQRTPGVGGSACALFKPLSSVVMTWTEHPQGQLVNRGKTFCLLGSTSLRCVDF